MSALGFNLDILEDNIFYYKNVIKNPRHLVYKLESTDDSLSSNTLISSWKLWTASNDKETIFGYQKQTNINAYDTSDQLVQSIYTELEIAIKNVSSDYFLKTGIMPALPQSVSISKYKIGAYMGPHVDSKGDGTDHNLVASAVLYLNDDYEGGELHFPNQGITIKPEAGSIVIFPSVAPYLHESKTITKGWKYMSPIFWVL